MKNRITETSWHRLMKMFRPTGFCMISACRGEYDEKTNAKRTLALKKDLEDKCFKPIKVYGGWIENQGTDEEKSVGEETWFVPFFFGGKSWAASEYDMKSTSIFYKWCLELGAKYEQESILYCPPNGKPRYVQTTEKDYGDGPVKKGTHTLKFNTAKIGDNHSAYFTDLSNPKHQGGYNSETGKFSKAPRRVTFESIQNSFKRVLESSVDSEVGWGNTKLYKVPYGQHNNCRLTYKRPRPDGTYMKILKYIVEHPGCKKGELLNNTVGSGLEDRNDSKYWKGNHSAMLQTLHSDEFFRISTKGEYFPCKKAVDLVKEVYGQIEREIGE